MTPSIKVVGWAPDVDPVTPGVITDCSMLEPSLRGMRSAPSAVSVGASALAAECRGAVLVQKLDGSRRLFAGTQTKLYELAGTSWTDRSVGGGTYTGASDSRWMFRQFGDVTIATNGVDTPQESTTGAFADMAEMPKCKLVETVANFVMAANITDAGYQYSDGWWCSALGDHDEWTPDVATQSVQGRLTEAPGPITALRAIGGDVVAFKAKAMFVGRYVGTPIVWSWQAVPGDVGTEAAEGVASDGLRLYFWGGDDFYAFDGSRPQPIGEVVRRWFVANSNPQYLYKTIAQYDRRSSLVRFWFPGTDSTVPNRCVVFNTRTGQWGRADRTIEAAVDFVPGALTYDAPGLLTAATFDSTAYPESYDSPLWTTGAENAAVVDSTHTVRAITGVGEASSMTTGVFGDDERLTLLRRVRVRYAEAPDTASMTEFYSQQSGATYTTGSTSSTSDGKHDFLRTARWHYLRADWTGSVEVTGYSLDAADTGAR